MKSRRYDALELMQALQLGHAVAALHALGVMDALEQPREPAELAEQLDLNTLVLTGLLDHAARSTQLLRRRGRRYRTTRHWNGEARFLVNMYGLAFGATVANAKALLKTRRLAPQAIDQSHHTQAFSADTGTGNGVLIALSQQLGIRRALDAGCGPATLLTDLAVADADFKGWGIDANRSMCAAARAKARQRGVAGRVRLIRADARRIAGILPARAAAEVQAVFASQFINEMFGNGPDRVIEWLRECGRAFPGRLLLIADYYGRLGSNLVAQHPLTLIHDHAQLLSGQGVPPARRRDWISLYDAAQCRLVHALEDRVSTRFIHVILLPGTLPSSGMAAGRGA